MALKDLLVYVDRTKAALVRMRLAVDLACRHASQLTALYVRELSPAQLHERSTAELGLASALQLDHLDRTHQASIDRAAARLRSALKVLEHAHGITAEWRSVNGLASVEVPQHARHADLSILGHRVGADPLEYSFSEQLLFGTGRPVLFVPDTGTSYCGGVELKPRCGPSGQ
jgi:nucleotide-binding universal stress UspA family protein